LKTAVFPLVNPEKVNVTKDHLGYGDAFYKIATLSAYAISSWTLIGNLADLDGVYNSDPMELQEDGVLIRNGYKYIDDFLRPKLSLSINYLGVKDYKCFFPHINNSPLCDRAAQLMEEADQTFETGSWMAFAVVAGGVFECLLYDHVTKNKKLKGKMTLGSLINEAQKMNIFDENLINSIVLAKDARNLVHADNYGKRYVSRSDSMSIKLSLDNILLLDWDNLG